MVRYRERLPLGGRLEFDTQAGETTQRLYNQYSQLLCLTTLTPRDSVEQAGMRALVLLGKAFNAIPPDGRQILCELVIAPPSLSRNRIKTQIKRQPNQYDLTLFIHQ